MHYLGVAYKGSMYWGSRKRLQNTGILRYIPFRPINRTYADKRATAHARQESHPCPKVGRPPFNLLGTQLSTKLWISRAAPDFNLHKCQPFVFPVFFFADMLTPT